MNPQQRFVECFGHPKAESLEVTVDGNSIRFLFDDQKAQQRRFHVGLFVDYATTTGRNYLRYPRSRRVALLSEPNSSLPYVDDVNLCRRFAFVMTHDARLIERGWPYVEFPFGTSFVPQALNSKDGHPKTRLLSMIGAPHANPRAGHILRNQVVEALRNRADVDCFGKGVRWIDSKLEGLADYAFSIAIENCTRDFYFTEKIIDCFLTETVPIYCGCASIQRYFDARGMIVFESLAELEQIIADLTFEKHQAMLPFVQANRDRAVSQKWATRSQLFERVGFELVRHFGNCIPWVRPTLFRIAQDVRRTLSGLSRSTTGDSQ